MATGAEILLNELIQSSCSSLPQHERTLERCSSPSLIYNLFKGNFRYSYNTYVEVFQMLRMRDFGVPAAPVKHSVKDRKKSSDKKPAEKYVQPYDTSNFTVKKHPSKRITIQTPEGQRVVSNEYPSYPFKRSNTHCFYCETPFITSGKKKTRDHIFPKRLGGGAGDNIVDACNHCNKEKGGKTIAEYRDMIMERLEKLKASKLDNASVSHYTIVLKNVEFMISKLYP